MKKCSLNKCPDRLNRVGGQAVLEGVMMKAGERTVTSCRTEDGSIVVTDNSFTSVRKKYKILNIPILRGVVNFIEMMVLSFKTLGASADALGIEEEDGKVEKWLKKHLGIRLTDAIMAVALVLGLLLSLTLFKLLPALIADGVNLLTIWLFSVDLGTWRVLIEGIVKIGIFIGYLYFTSLIPDIKRTFMYHGAEHKSIACFESGEELTPENAAKHKRFHPRCGTSYLFLMILIGMAISLAIRCIFPNLTTWQYVGISLVTLPLTMGIGYEVLMLAGKHDNFITRFISAPGLWVQRITTKEPTLEMLEVAITSIKCALRDDFPEFREFFNSRGWEKKPDGATYGPDESGAEITAIPPLDFSLSDNGGEGRGESTADTPDGNGGDDRGESTANTPDEKSGSDKGTTSGNGGTPDEKSDSDKGTPSGNGGASEGILTPEAKL